MTNRPSVNSPTAALRGGARRQSSQHSSDMSLVGCGAALAGIAMLSSRRARQAETARRVTLSDINKIKLSDVPPFWRIKMSIGRARRYALTAAIGKELEDTFFIMAVNKDFMKSSDFKAARNLFPTSVKCRVLRNNLVKKAMEGTEWEPLGDRLKGSNMYIFVKKDTELKATIEAVIKMDKRFDRENVIAAGLEKIGAASEMTFQLKPIVGGMMADEWTIIEPEDIPKFKDFPTKTELIGKIAGSIKQVTTKVAKGIKQVPTKVAIGIKATVEKGEEDGKSLVGDVTP